MRLFIGLVLLAVFLTIGAVVEDRRARKRRRDAYYGNGSSCDDPNCSCKRAR